MWVYKPASHKGQHHGRERLIFIGPNAQSLLGPYLERPAETYCFSPAEAKSRRFEAMRANRKTKVQPSQVCRKKPAPKRKPADRYSKNSYNRAIGRACDQADAEARKRNPGVPVNQRLVLRWHTNQLRHAAATELRRLEAAQVILGHSRADVTQVYAERDHGLAARVMREVG